MRTIFSIFIFSAMLSIAVCPTRIYADEPKTDNSQQKIVPASKEVVASKVNTDFVGQHAFTLPSGVAVTIVEAPFDKLKFSISGCSDNEPCFINDHIPFGVDWGLPKTYVKEITVSYNGSMHSLDASDMYNAWGDRPLEFKGSIRYFGGKCFDAKNCQFRGLFSDGAGSFVAEWYIIDGKSFRTLLSADDDVTDLFSKNIDPPEYE